MPRIPSRPNPWRSPGAWPLLMVAWLALGGPPGPAASEPELGESQTAAEIQPSPAAPIRHLKGGAQLGEPPAWPTTRLSLLPRPTAIVARVQRAEVPADVAATPARVCSPALAAAPLPIGEKDRFAKLGGLVKGMAMGALGQLLETASGGIVSMGGKDEVKPELYEDPIDRGAKQRVDFDDVRTRLRVGAKLASDGLMLSTRLDKAPDKGTIHAIYLEDTETCERIFPFAYWAYELWGEWSLTVSWTRTVDTYQDGQLIDRDVSSGGFSDAGRELLASDSGGVDLATGQGQLPPGVELDELRQYQAELLREIGTPMWAAQGFGAPTSGIRSAGSPFRATPEQLERIREGKWAAVVHVTRDEGSRYETAGLPMRLVVGPDQSISFESLRPE